MTTRTFSVYDGAPYGVDLHSLTSANVQASGKSALRRLLDAWDPNEEIDVAGDDVWQWVQALTWLAMVAHAAERGLHLTHPLSRNELFPQVRAFVYSHDHRALLSLFALGGCYALAQPITEYVDEYLSKEKTYGCR